MAHDVSQQGMFHNWRQFRQDLIHLSTVPEYLAAVARYFGDCKIGSRYLDFYNPTSWPSPWDIISEANFCVNELSILMYHTLDLAEDFDAQLRLELINDTQYTYLVLVVDDQYVLNFKAGEVVDYPLPETNTLMTFGCDEIKSYA